MRTFPYAPKTSGTCPRRPLRIDAHVTGEVRNIRSHIVFVPHNQINRDISSFVLWSLGKTYETFTLSCIRNRD